MSEENTYKVLDHGFVRLVSHMGDDARIAEAARCSYQNGTKKTRNDAGLIDYLIRNDHGSPLEMVLFTFHIKAPIFVARQWCIAGESLLHFENGGGKWRRPKSVKETYEQFKNGGRVRQQLMSKSLRSYSHTDDEVSSTNIKDIWISGEKPTYRVTVKTPMDNFEIVCSADHPFLTSDGYMELKEIASLPSDSDSDWSSNKKVMVVGRGMDKIETSLDRFFIPEYQDEEQWRELKTFPFYSISSHGRVMNRRNNRILKPVPRVKGNYSRLQVSMKNIDGKHKSSFVHKLVAEAFLPSKEGAIVCHIDGNTYNNHVDNLIYGTHKRNYADSKLHGTCAAPHKKYWYCEITDIQYEGVQTVYDIEVTSDDHNFVCGGFVVHNCRHRISSTNELSGRYSVMPEEMYLPDVAQIQPQSTTNKQGRAGKFEIEEADDIIENMVEDQTLLRDSYDRLIETGLTRELARINLPLAQYTEFYWTVNLRSLMNFLKLRMDGHAQYEIRKYAYVLSDIAAEIVPFAMESFEKHILDAVTFSSQEMFWLERIMDNVRLGDVDGLGLVDADSKEFERFIKKLGLGA